MKAVQIDHYNKEMRVFLRDVPEPRLRDSDVLVRVKAAAVNPLEVLLTTGSVRLIQDYPMPLTLGNECSGVVEKVGREVRKFRPGDHVCARLPLDRIGAFAEYAAVDESALAKMPDGCGFDRAAAIPLTGLTAWQGITEELEAKPGQTLLIPGGSGSFGQMAVPIAKALGLHVIVTGNARARDGILALGADRYLDYRTEHYWELPEKVDHVIDTLGAGEFQRELSVLKEGGRLLSLRAGPNRTFALRRGCSPLKTALFTLAGLRFDRDAHRQGKEYRFLFVRADGGQLEKVVRIAQERQLRPALDPRRFSLEQAGEALRVVANGPVEGKVLIEMD